MLLNKLPTRKKIEIQNRFICFNLFKQENLGSTAQTYFEDFGSRLVIDCLSLLETEFFCIFCVK